MRQENITPCHIIIMLDSCYAMRRIKEAVTEGYNSFVRFLNKYPGMDITTVLYGEQQRVLWERVNPSECPELTVQNYETCGKSMFCDGAKLALELGERLSAPSKKSRYSMPEKVVCFVVMYDYNENNHNCSAYHLKQLMAQRLDINNFNMVLFGSGQNTRRIMDNKHLLECDGLYAAGYYPDRDGIEKMFDKIDKITAELFGENNDFYFLGMDDIIQIICNDSRKELDRLPGSIYGRRLRDIYKTEEGRMNPFEEGAMRHADLYHEVLPMIVFEPQEEICGIYDSKVGGVPYFPADMDYPVHKGIPLPFFAQINLDRLGADIIENMPERGMLQFYMNDSGDFRVIYHEKIIYNEALVCKKEDIPKTSGCRFTKWEMKLEAKGIFPCPITADDGKLSFTLCPYFNCASPESFCDKLDMLSEGMKEKGLRVNNNICMGGYVSTLNKYAACNHNEYKIQLFQFFDEGLQSSVHFMISEEDIKIRAFDRAVLFK